MSIKAVTKHIDAIERKLGKSVKISEKGDSMKLSDVVKLGRKTNSMVSEMNKSVKEYDVRRLPTALQGLRSWRAPRGPSKLLTRKLVGSQPNPCGGQRHPQKDGEGRELD